MKKTATGTRKQKLDEYMANYGEMTKKLLVLSRMNVRQFLGTRKEGDPRVEYLTQIEAFKNLTNVQLSTLLEVVSKMFGSKGGELLKVFEAALTQQVQAMEESLGVTGWKEDGMPTLDLQAHLENTQGWPE